VKDSFSKIVSYLVYNQIWLNLLADDRKFGYITKLENKNPSLSISTLGTALQLWTYPIVYQGSSFSNCGLKNYNEFF
jgi:hypothetical protein